MCGITGAFTFRGQDPDLGEVVGRLSQMMVRRGPDDAGLWNDGRCALATRRLAVLDLTGSAHQPMASHDGRWVLSYNGEIYNYAELKARLGLTPASTGDTEAVLYSLIRWGVDALPLFNGMFALALYDRLERRLLLARDHAGIKPLYYLAAPQGLMFASQYDQILAHPWTAGRDISTDGLALYLRLGYLPAPYAMVKGSHMLEAGTWLQVEADGRLKTGRFFEFPVFRQPDLSGEEAYEAVDAAVTAAVRSHRASDVPLGSFLSGGIDSPLVAAMLARLSNDPIRTFTIGNEVQEIDEAADAAVYAQQIGSIHAATTMTAADAAAAVDDVVAACGEPLADFSVFPTMLVSRLARADVTVLMSGDGGDELFWGYAERFGSVLRMSAQFQSPPWMRSARWWTKKYLGAGDRTWNLRHPTIGDWYRAKHTRLPESWLRRIFPEAGAWPAEMKLFTYSGSNADETAQWLRWNEFVGHLSMVLLKVDRASMHHSVEARVPLLDRGVIDVATRVDWESCLDLDRGLGKLPLRAALSKRLAHQTLPKRGFSVPMGTWLRASLRPVFEDAFRARTSLAGLPIEHKALRALMDEHVSGRHDWGWALWLLLNLALWESHHYSGARARSHVLPFAGTEAATRIEAFK